MPTAWRACWRPRSRGFRRFASFGRSRPTESSRRFPATPSKRSKRATFSIPGLKNSASCAGCVRSTRLRKTSATSCRSSPKRSKADASITPVPARLLLLGPLLTKFAPSPIACVWRKTPLRSRYESELDWACAPRGWCCGHVKYVQLWPEPETGVGHAAAQWRLCIRRLRRRRPVHRLRHLHSSSRDQGHHEQSNVDPGYCEFWHGDARRTGDVYANRRLRQRTCHCHLLQRPVEPGEWIGDYRHRTGERRK